MDDQHGTNKQVGIEQECSINQKDVTIPERETRILELSSITPPTHWEIASEVLCNYMKEPEYLEDKLERQAIIPRYNMEPTEYLRLKGITKICFPMICFCDIPLSKVSSHISRYGSYGIGFDKNKIINKSKIQPIHYINPASRLADDFRETFLKAYDGTVEFTEQNRTLIDYLVSTLVYMKPISERAIVDNKVISKNFQDECEWRFIPLAMDNEIPLVLPQDQTSELLQKKYNDIVLPHHPETWMRFEWDDIRYLIVPDEAANKRLIRKIRNLSLDSETQDYLISTIEISSHFSEDR